MTEKSAYQSVIEQATYEGLEKKMLFVAVYSDFSKLGEQTYTVRLQGP